MKCLEKDRARRYETANGLAADHKRHLNHEPVVARPPSAAYRFQKAFRRNTLVFAAGTAVIFEANRARFEGELAPAQFANHLNESLLSPPAWHRFFRLGVELAR